jgi:hypothetical protein
MKIDVNHDGRDFIVDIHQEKGTALVTERVVIFEGKRRKFYDEKIRWIHLRDHPPLKTDPFYERVIELARSAL